MSYLFLVVNAICCDHKFDICGYIEYMDGEVANLHTLFLVLEDPQRFYVVDTEGKCMYLVGENIHVFSKCGLYRCDEMFRVPTAKYTVKVDELLAELIECKDDVPKFGAVLESRMNKRYLMRSRYSDEKYILMFFILRKGSFPNKYDWDKIHDTLDDLPQDSIIIGCIGRGLVYPKTCVLVLGSDRAVYGISTIGPHFQTGQNCMKLADDFDMFLRMGFSRCAGSYKFLARDGGRALHDAQPTCPHYNDAEDGIADFDTSDDE
ncbi:IE-B [Suid betaherpesvirus 2]|uniref:IE-B n=1 Tax=Suid betaherpesvirus 2 TaxID=1608255 RepID=U3GS13_9BETA|nr:IE-B [Suid betaherpesvirus 2]AGT99214.1 IE-B [Suid betaherpesvirus 2]